MARQFNGTNQSLQSASTINLSTYNKITVAYWINVNAYSATYVHVETSAISDSTAGTFGIFSDNTANQYIQLVGDAGASNVSVAHPSAGAWHHYVHIYDFTASSTFEIPQVWIDAVAQNPTGAGPNNTVNFGNFALNLMSRNNTTYFTPGQFGEFAIWGNYLFNQTDVSALYNGGPPSGGALATTVQSGSLVYYNQIRGTTSPEPATVGTVALTVNGATAVTSFLDNLYGTPPPTEPSPFAVGLGV